MMYFKLLFIFMFMFEFLFSAATFNQNVTAAQLATTIQGKGITITNPVITRGQIGGNNSQVATFTNGIAGANLQIDAGVLLTASTAIEAFSTNNSGHTSHNPGDIDNVAGLPTYDANLLSTISQAIIKNQVVFEFDVTLDTNTRLLLVDYQFASDEYPEWVGSVYNDAFGFFISGGDLNQTYNIARVVNDSIIVNTVNIANYPPVNINNVNNGSVGSLNQGQTVDLTNSTFFIDNGGTNTGTGINVNNIVIESEFDGFTTRLHATLDNLTPDLTYHFKMALADTSDMMWDAGVFVNKIIGVRVPDVCYDYDVHMGNIFIPSDHNDIDVQPYPGEQLTLGIAIQSLEGELPLLDTNLSVILQPINGLQLDTAYLSPDSINAYVQIPPAYVKKVPYAQVPIGENINSIGGTINSNQVIFTKFNYDFNGTAPVNTHFELTSDITLNLNGILIQRKISTANGTLPRCPTEEGYHPDAASINVERRDSDQGPESHRHLLYTQIAGKPFDIDVVSYDPDDLNDQKKLNNMTFEVELIDAGKYLNSSKSLFTCREPDSISNGSFVKFADGADSERVPLNAVNTNTALRNAAFRLWYFEDLNNTAVPYTCANYNNACFQSLYNTKFKDIIDKTPYKCQTACSAGNCYECLKKYFAKPICSRDNFAIRPEAYSISILDNNESSTPTDPSILIGKNNASSPTLKLAAEYKYKLEGNATRYGSNSNALGYYTTAASALVSQFNFNMPSSTCADSSNKDIGAIFYNGQIKYTINGTDINFTNNNLYNHDNVGTYNYHIEDSNWTIVDQASYAYKTFPEINECDPSTASSALDGNDQYGCNISSSSLPYFDLPLEFKPYKFQLTPIILQNNPNATNTSWLYMNNLSKDYRMAVKFDGNLSAIGRNGTVLSNYTNNCAAEDVQLWVEANITNLAQTINRGSDNNISDINGNNNISFQQVLKDVDNNSGMTANADNNVTLEKNNFISSDNNGSAKVELYVNFKKPYANLVNPLDVNFSKLHADSSSATSNAHLSTNYIPDGNKTYNNGERYFLFAKVAPKLGDDYIVTYDSNYTTYLRVDIYCQNLAGINCSVLEGLNLFGTQEESMSGVGGGWHRASFHTASSEGNVTSLTEETGISGITEIDYGISNITFDNNGSTAGVILTYPLGSVRPKTFMLTISPDEWLKFDFNDSRSPSDPDFGKPRFPINYRSRDLRWKGTGDTGNVIDTQPNSGTNKRMSW